MNRLWACHDCQMIGTEAEGRAHFIAKGHEPVELSEEETAGVRAIWAEDQAKRAAAFALAARGRGVFAGLLKEQG